MELQKTQIEQDMDTICRAMENYNGNPNWLPQALFLFIKQNNPIGFTRDNGIRLKAVQMTSSVIKGEILKHAVKYKAYQDVYGKPTLLVQDANQLDFSVLTNTEAKTKMNPTVLLDTYYYFLASQRPEVIEAVTMNPNFFTVLIDFYVNMRYQKEGPLQADVLDTCYTMQWDARQVIEKIDAVYPIAQTNIGKAR